MSPVRDPIGRWIRRRSQQCPALTEWRAPTRLDAIETIWYFDGAVSSFRELHLPTGSVDIVVQLDDSFRRVNDRVQARYPAASIAGLRATPMRIDAFRRQPSMPHRTRIVGVRFHPAAVSALVDHALDDTTGRIVDLEDLIGRAADELIVGCFESRDAEECVRHAARWAYTRIARSTRLDRQVQWCAMEISRTRGRVSVARLQQDTGLTSQQLTERFRRQIGMTPKLYARIVRFRRALALLHRGLPAAHVAAATGYYDQPHMHLDFHALAGLTPRQFLDAKRHSADVLGT